VTIFGTYGPDRRPSGGGRLLLRSVAMEGPFASLEFALAVFIAAGVTDYIDGYTRESGSAILPSADGIRSPPDKLLSAPAC